MDRYQNPEPRYRDADTKDSVSESMAGRIGERGNDHAESESHGPGGNTVQLGFDGTVAVSKNDSGGKISVSIGWDDQAEVHESSNDDFVVLEDSADVFEGDRSFPS